MKKVIRGFVALVVALVALSATCVKGQQNSVTPPSTPFLIGTPELVESNAVSKVNWVGVYVWAYKTNGQFVPYASGSWQNTNFPHRAQSPPYFTNKAHLDNFIVDQLKSIMGRFLTDTNQMLHSDKSRGIAAYIRSSMIVNGFADSLDIFTTPGYYYIKPDGTNGNYTVPSLPDFSLKLNESVPFYIPGLQWARLEIGFYGDPFPFEVDDWRLDPATDPIGSDGFLYLPTEVISNSSASNGLYSLKISVFDGEFKSYDGDGKLLPETPMLLGMAKNGTNVIITVNGGDSGRGYRLQQSSDLRNWTNCSPVNFISPLSYYGESDFVFATTNVMSFRTVTVNAAPY